MKSTLWALMAVLAVSSCAKKNEPEKADTDTPAFLQNYRGTFVDTTSYETLTIKPDGTYIRTQLRQVGMEGDAQIPYPTVCSYRIFGKIQKLIVRTQEARTNYMDYATHEIKYGFENLVLVDSLEPSSTSNPSCQNFARGFTPGGVNTEFAELLGPYAIRLHTSGGGDYVAGRQRTASTLDEVFTKDTHGKPKTQTSK